MLSDYPSILQLIKAEELPPFYGCVVTEWWLPLARRIADARSDAGRSIVVGVNGAQGSGKSTLCLFLERLLVGEFGCSVATLSIDDLYLGKTERDQLARSIHPLLATRGVPGTHDVQLGERVIRRLTSHHDIVPVPRFDKAVDDRLPPERWRCVAAPVDVVLFEGWCVAARPQPSEQLARPINSLEASEDSNGLWRAYVNRSLANRYCALFRSIDLLVMLKVPSFDSILQWRLHQERQLRKVRDTGMSDQEVRRFILHYERLTRHMLFEMPHRADITVDLDPLHMPAGATGLDDMPLIDHGGLSAE